MEVLIEALQDLQEITKRLYGVGRGWCACCDHSLSECPTHRHARALILHHSNFLNLACVAGKLKKTQEEANIAKMEIQEKKEREKKASSDKKELAS